MSAQHGLECVLQAAATRAAEVLSDFTPQAVANLMWAFAALSHNPGTQLQCIDGVLWWLQEMPKT